MMEKVGQSQLVSVQVRATRADQPGRRGGSLLSQLTTLLGVVMTTIICEFNYPNFYTWGGGGGEEDGIH